MGGGLLLVASSAIITLAACSSFNLHKDNIIRNAADNTITVNGNRVFKRFTSESNTLEEGNYLIGGEIGGSLYFAQKYVSGKKNISCATPYVDSNSSFEIYNFSKYSETSDNWKIRDSSNNYVYCASSSTDSYLKTKSDLDNKCEWIYNLNTNKTVKLSANIPSSTTKRTILRFNPNTSNKSPLLNCYASGQNDILLYKEVLGTQYTVTFDTGVEGLTVNPQKVEEGQTAKAPETLINGEKVAKSWYVLGDETKTPFNFETTAITQDITLVAIWEESTEKIVQFYDEDKTTLLGEKVANVGKTITAIENPTKEGYEFDKWVDEEGNAFDFSKPITKMTKLFATYKNLDVTSIADAIANNNTTDYIRVEGEVNTILSNVSFTIDDGTSGIICYDKSATIVPKIKVGNKIAISGKYTLYNGSPELTNFVTDTLEIIESDELISSFKYKDLKSIDFADKTNLGRLVELRKFTMPSDLTINKQQKIVSDGVTLFVSDVTNLPSGKTFKAGTEVNITGYTTLFNEKKEVIITSIEEFDLAGEMVKSDTIDWVSFKYKSYEDGTYGSFSDIALNFSVMMPYINETSLTEGGVIMIKGTNADWIYESSLTSLPVADNSNVFVQSFKSMEQSAIGLAIGKFGNQYTMRIKFASFESAKANYETSFVIAPYFKVNDTYYIGNNKIETSIKKALINSAALGCDINVVEALAATLAN